MSKLLDAVAAHARTQPRVSALTDSATIVSYGDLPREIGRVAGQLDIHFPKPGPVALCLENSIAWVLLDLALLQAGRPVIPLPTFLTASQRAHALEETGAVYLITDRAQDGEISSTFSMVAGCELYCIACPADSSRPALPPGTAKVTYTSGSTGQPKGVCLSLAGMETVAESIVERIGSDYAGVHCAILPLGVLLENVAGLYPTLMAGGCYHVPTPSALGLEQPFRPDFARLVHALAACAATSVIMVPELLRGTIMALARSDMRLPDLTLLAVGGAAVSVQLLVEAEALGLPVVQGYGLSEMGSVVALNAPSDNVTGTVGSALPHVDLVCAEDGELLIGNPLFLGYVGAPATSGIYATGDLADIDAAGRIRLLGRKSNVIITSFGRNVSPEWIEGELLGESTIGQAFVFGDAGPALGALVVPASAMTRAADLEAAIARVNERLPDYAVIRHWSAVMPFTPANGGLTGNGRLRRAAIADRYAARIARCLQQPGRYRSFYDRLVEETAVERAALQQVPQIQDGLRGRVSRESYLAYLGEAYHHVKHTVPLMQLAASKLSPGQAWLRPALDDYIAEESGHEAWILDDIRNAGGDADVVREAEPRPATASMVAYAYDYIRRVNPVGFFGMVFVLEGTSTQLASLGAEALMESLRLPRECFSYLLSHGALDIAHMDFFRRLMDRIEDERDQAAVIEVAKAMFGLFAALFASIPHTRPASDVA
ncbi:Long-chain acyl-CoA synthetase (AMP-forming) [Enhydrobacter aerosaccus]|uniref:Long-chain acyl-CoA synthetase (AMP-forming) n=1 Tax=Enhydrobacter aerosaccus TaxID=225324 RepID=A0A1T4R3J7_9HYPH|nr:AMP-binding protein [Enhydrobacter aerosaccus]SKA10624.1 Long-chain acyl-CoA synthetase (AMP-forming) [Enhydrobacter aerosaccus]